MGALLEVQNLRKFFQSRKGLFFGKTEWLRAVDGISFEIHEHENLGLVGESGCGKSTTAKCILRLVEPDDGTIIFDGVDILSLKESELLKVRRNMQMIVQD
ncbi:MAG: ATP-binding cassette domain-containing protein, partial [Promethearchaeota archaeon]